ncbi:hypothetical protein D3OALGA1CA_1261 [Olavius algarvensis associated proteobacterium Delta 3]|nr:hypothetical protein D3OALGA1CA_1261 [Olavius algarvensis associated proteobacterium Delta 3]CAB5102572.1 hypothetical protein D3OALGB2SA_1927 [Olavius algarvensis associated proteobacterium Delta 3]
MKKGSKGTYFFWHIGIFFFAVAFFAWLFDLPELFGYQAANIWRAVYFLLTISTGYLFFCVIKKDDSLDDDPLSLVLMLLFWLVLFVYNCLPPEFQQSFSFMEWLD